MQARLASASRNCLCEADKLAAGEEDRLDEVAGIESVAGSLCYFQEQANQSTPSGHWENTQAGPHDPPLSASAAVPAPPEANTAWQRKPEKVGCSLCNKYIAMRPRNLVRHVASKQRGQELGETGPSSLRGCDPGICRGAEQSARTAPATANTVLRQWRRHSQPKRVTRSIARRRWPGYRLVSQRRRPRRSCLKTWPRGLERFRGSPSSTFQLQSGTAMQNS